jgi:hypothetical protein
MTSKQFTTDAIIEQAVTSWLQTLVTDIFHAVVYALEQHWHKCLNANSDYYISYPHAMCTSKSEHETLQETVDNHIFLKSSVDEEKVNLFSH